MRKKLIFWIFLSVILSAEEEKISVYLDEKRESLRPPFLCARLAIIHQQPEHDGRMRSYRTCWCVAAYRW